MTILPNFPLVNQNTTVTGDGRPSENALYDCVAASIDAMCRYWLKTPENSVFNPDHFKDAAYGENWRNDGTDAARYVDFCKSLGIHLYAVSANDANHVVSLAHEYIDKGIPVTFTELDPYVDTNLPQYAGWTHACCFFADDTNGLTALDPFIGKALYKSNGAWANVLRSNQLWIAERIATTMVPTGWHDDGTTLIAPNGVHVVLGFREYVLSHTWDSGNWPLAPQFHTEQLEGVNPGLGAGDAQYFRWTVLQYSQARGVFEMWCGMELQWTRNKLAETYTAYQQALQQNQALQSQIKANIGLSAAKVADRLQALELLFKQGETLATQPIL